MHCRRDRHRRPFGRAAAKPRRRGQRDKRSPTQPRDSSIVGRLGGARDNRQTRPRARPASFLCAPPRVMPLIRLCVLRAPRGRGDKSTPGLNGSSSLLQKSRFQRPPRTHRFRVSRGRLHLLRDASLAGGLPGRLDERASISRCRRANEHPPSRDSPISHRFTAANEPPPLTFPPPPASAEASSQYHSCARAPLAFVSSARVSSVEKC